YVAGGEGQHERANYSFRALEAYEPATNRWIVLPSMPTARHGVAGAFVGNKLHLVSGKPEGGTLADLQGKGLPVHDVLEIPANFGTHRPPRREIPMQHTPSRRTFVKQASLVAAGVHFAPWLKFVTAADLG